MKPFIAFYRNPNTANDIFLGRFDRLEDANEYIRKNYEANLTEEDLKDSGRTRAELGQMLLEDRILLEDGAPLICLIDNIMYPINYEGAYMYEISDIEWYVVYHIAKDSE